MPDFGFGIFTFLAYARELVSAKIGTLSVFFFFFAFGLGGTGAALFGRLADIASINFVYHACAFLPAVGIPTAFLPNLSASRTSATR